MALTIVVVIGTATLLFDVISLNKSVISPFFQPQATGTIKTSDQIEQERVASLKSMDTDKDGLTDFDELYAFRTSPYIADTDSDGTPDGLEISQNSDPKCPAGKTCRQVSISSSSGASTAPTLSSGLTDLPEEPVKESVVSDSQSPLIQAVTRIFGDPAELTQKKAEAIVAQMTGDDLRKFYVEIGLPTELVAKAPDDALRQLMLDTLKDAGLTNNDTGQ
jgi:hypothetical protein